MSGINYALLTDTLIEETNQTFVDACNNDQFLYNMIKKVGPSGNGKSTWQFINARPTAKGFREGDTFKNPDRFTQEKPELPPGYFHQVLSVTGHARDALKNASALQISDWLMQQYAIAAESMINEIEEAIYGGDDTDSEFVGLGSAIDDGNTYATINRASETKFRAYVNDNSGTPRALTVALLNTTHNAITQTNRAKYNTILASPTQVAAWRALAADVSKLGGQVQVTGNIYNQVTGTGTQEFGASGLWFYGVQVTQVPGYPTDRIDFLDLTPMNCKIEMHRDFEVSAPERVNDDTVWDITTGQTLVLVNPRRGSGRLADLS